MIIFFSKFFQRNIKVTLISLPFFLFQCTFHNSWFFSGYKTHNDTCLFFSSKNEKRGDKQKAISLSLDMNWTTTHVSQGVEIEILDTRCQTTRRILFPFLFSEKNYQTKKNSFQKVKRNMQRMLLLSRRIKLSNQITRHLFVSARRYNGKKGADLERCVIW